MTRVWTPQQQAVFDFVREGTGHGVVTALAGTGKSSTLIESIRHVRAGARVLCLAFNARIAEHLRGLVPPGVTVRTFHTYGRDCMRAYPTFRGFQHNDDKDREMVERALLGSRYVRPAKGAAPAPAERDEVVACVERGASLVKATLVQDQPGLLALLEQFDLRVDGIDDTEMSSFIAQAVYTSIAAWPSTSFDDEVWLPVQHALALQAYDVVYCDEYQDASFVQFRLAQSALTPGGRLMVFGDELQCIYSWRGADAHIFTRMKEMGATELPLTVTWRCPRKVVELARAYAPAYEAAPDAPEGVVSTLSLESALDKVRSGDVILSRLNAPLPKLALKLARRRVPAKITGSRDYAAVLKRLVQRSRATTLPGLSAWLKEYEARELVRARKVRNAKVAASLVADKVEALGALIAESATVSEVLRRLDTLFSDFARNAVILSTTHRLKGEEAERVFVLRETFFLPWGDEDEESKVWYVAITRVRAELTFVVDLYRQKV